MAMAPKRRSWIAGVLIAAALPAAGAPPQKDPAATQRSEDDTTLDAARTAIGGQQPDAALRLLEPLRVRLEAKAAKEKRRVYSSQTPTQLLTYMMMAARDKVDAVDLGPNLAEANFWEAFALTDARRDAEAGPYYERAAALSPLNPQYLCELAHWHAMRKKTDVALGFYQSCFDNVGFGPEDAVQHRKAIALRGKGYVLIDMGKLGEAEKAYRDSLAIEPNAKVALDDLKYIAQQRAHPGRNTI